MELPSLLVVNLQSIALVQLQHTINPPRWMNIEQTIEISLGTWPTMILAPGLRFTTATADVSCGLPGSLSQGSSSLSMAASQISLYL